MNQQHTLAARPLAGGNRLIRQLLICLLPALAFANAGAYIAYAANPLAMADAWYFIDAFLVHAYEHGFGLIDLYVKRGGTDHAQPLQKLLLLANAHWFDLDFVAESFAGLTLALATYLVIQSTVLPDQRRTPSPLPFWQSGLVCAAIAASLVSLNAGMIFNWSLVTLGYLPHLFAVIAAIWAWRGLEKGKWLRFGLMFLLIAFSLDSMAMITGASLIAAGMLAALRKQTDWRNLAKLIGTVIVMLLLYQLASRYYLHNQLPKAAPGAGATDALMALLPSIPAMATTILSAAFVHPLPLGIWFGDGAGTVQIAIATAAGIAHLWFWYAALKRPWNSSVFLAICMMLMFYASVLGIIVGRIVQFGPTYLNEPRYVLTYQMSTVAMLVMFMGTARAAAKHQVSRYLAVAVMIAIVLLQWPLSRHSRDEGRYLQGYYHTMARQMYLLGLDPTLDPVSCVPMLTICSRPIEERLQSIAFLQRHQLNAYSPAVLERYSLQASATPPQPAKPQPVSIEP
jgi:hypothetical protein